MLRYGPPTDTNIDSAAHVRSPRWLAPVVILWLATAIWLYTPFSARPYDILDFANFLPILRTSTSVVDGVADLTTYYAQNHGRFNVGAFSLLSLKWSIFGENMLGWQLFRFAEMCGLAALLYVVLRRIGVSYAAAFAATVVMLASPSAAANWMIMSVAEPPGTVCLLILMLLMARQSARGSTPLFLLAVGGLTVIIGLFKEMLLATVLVPGIVLTLRSQPAGHRRVRDLLRSQPLWATCIAGILVAIPILWIALGAPATSYSRKFGAQTTALNALMPALAILIPFAPGDPSAGVPLLLAVCAYVVILVAGWGLLLRMDRRTNDTVFLLTLGLGLPLSGVLAYAPWPSFSLIYALPFQIGTAILVGLAVTEIGKRSPASAPLLLVSGVLVAAVMIGSAHHYARFRTVSLQMSRDLASYIGTLDPNKDVHFEVCGPPPERWENYGLIMTLYATSRGLSHPTMVDAPCHGDGGDEDADRLGGHVILSNEPLSAGQHGTLSYTFTTMDWSSMSTRRHSLVLTMRNLPAP